VCSQPKTKLEQNKDAAFHSVLFRAVNVGVKKSTVAGACALVQFEVAVPFSSCTRHKEETRTCLDLAPRVKGHALFDAQFLLALAAELVGSHKVTCNTDLAGFYNGVKSHWDANLTALRTQTRALIQKQVADGVQFADTTPASVNARADNAIAEGLTPFARVVHFVVGLPLEDIFNLPLLQLLYFRFFAPLTANPATGMRYPNGIANRAVSVLTTIGR
jgi:hypothetical protein